GIYVAIAFLAASAVSVVNSDQDFLEEDFYEDGIPIKCPLPQPNFRNTTTNIPHENDCTLFYKCNLGRAIKQQCPLMIEGDPQTRLHYNRRLQVCDWPWQAGCSSCAIQYPNGTFPPPEKMNNPKNDCQYIECRNGVESEPINCQPGTCFSRTCQKCVGDRTGGKCSDEVINPGCQPLGDTKFHDCSCTLYHACRNINGQNLWIWEECTGGLHYSPIQKICQTPDIAGCPHLK
ncbi:hypothetical protein ALC62_04967, partial [Cyphomyrmex costatus]